MRPYTEEPGAEQFARPVLDWRRKGRPLRRPYGKKRPLGISEGNDKLLQEVVRTILEKIYEPVFEESSHRFRTARSPHTALEGIKQEWQADLAPDLWKRESLGYTLSEGGKDHAKGAKNVHTGVQA